MSLQLKAAGVFSEVGGGGGGGDVGWVRPADWLALPAVVVGDQKLVGLHAVYDNSSNFCAFSCAGAYTVDWGDGTAPEDFNSGVQANHNFAYSALDPGTLSTRGYRQAIVTVTPQAGQNLTSLDLSVKHTQAGLASGYSSGWLDLGVVGALVSFLRIGFGVGTLRHSLLERFEYAGPSAVTSLTACFVGCGRLASVVGTAWTAGVTGFTGLFNGCHSLTTVPLLATSSGLIFNTMFNGCRSLTAVPLFDTAAGTDFSSMFNDCTRLPTVPLLDTGSGVNFTSMFANCTTLRSVPALDLGSGTSFSSMFNGCTNLRSVPLFTTGNAGAGQTFGTMFANCQSLDAVSAFDTSSGTSFTNMFANCFSLAVGTLAGTKETISYANCCLGPAELDAIFTALATVVGKTITTTGNWGKAASNPSIATAKGWTVG